MAKIVDPDDLTRNTEIVITPATKLIQLVATGNLSNASPAKTSGVTFQAVYSKIKELWRSETDLNKMLFPFKMITEVKGDLINGWDWADATTRQLIRDGGWALRAAGTGTLQESYTGIVSLGDVYEDGDQAYYAQALGWNVVKSNFSHTGEVNEAIKVYGDATHGDFDYRSYLKVLLRVSSATTTQKTHSQNNLVVEQDLATLDYTVYKLPLTNAIDIKFTHADSYIAANTPYTGMSIDFIVGQLFEQAAATTYVADDVVRDGTGRWARCTTGGTVTTPGGAWASFGGTSVWEAYPGEIQIGANYYAFNVLVDANNSGNTCDRNQVYEFLQWSLRQSTDINANTGGDGYGTVYGNVCKPLAYFVGDKLHTYGGVGILDFNANDTNDIVMHDITVDGGGLDTEDSPLTSTERPFPFVAAGTMVFSDNLVNEPDADTYYRMYFLNDDAGDNLGYDFDTTNAIVVNDNSSSPIQGQITQKNISFDYDYDGNTQRGTGSDGTDAPVVVVAIGKAGAEWVVGYFTITANVGLTFPVNASDERNYSNP